MPRPFTLLVFLGTLLAACASQPSQQDKKNNSIPVFIGDVVLQDVPVYIESIGILKPAAIVEIRSQVNGMLTEVHFTEGQIVARGSPLFSIDPQPYRIQLQEAEARLAQVKASWNAASKKLERYQGLNNKELIPKQEWDELTALVAKNKGSVEEEEAKTASAKLNLTRCLISSPLQGKSGKVEIHPGNLVSAGQAQPPLVTISQIDHLVVEFKLTEEEVQQLNSDHLSGRCPLEISSLSQGQETKGTLAFLDHTYDPQTGLLRVQGRFPNENNPFLPGQSVKVKLPISMLAQAKLIPQKAIKINQQGPYAFVLKKDNTVELRQITLGEEYGDQVIVLDGVIFGEQVVTDGHLRLSPGCAVEVQSAKEAL